MRNKIIDKAFADNRSLHLPNMGGIPEQICLSETWTTNLLNLFEGHFSEHNYLLGERPTVADFTKPPASLARVERMQRLLTKY